MKLPFFIAGRYLFSKKTTNIINVLSLISFIGILLISCALVIILSAFSGFEKQILDAYNPVNPDIRITAKEGKSFVPDTALLEKIKRLDGVELVVPIIQEKGILRFKENTSIATFMGLPPEGEQIYDFDTLMYAGEFYTSHNGYDFVVVGYPIAVQLQLDLFSLDPMQVYATKRGKRSGMSLQKAFNSENIRPSGVYDADPEFTKEHVVVSFDFAKKLFSMDNRITSWEVKSKNTNFGSTIKKIKGILGADFEVRNRYELNPTLFKILKVEKLFVFLILALILFIAGFNIVGSLSMIIIDKKNDIGVLQSMGASRRLIKRIFVIESLMISLFGAFFGLAIGLVVSLLQQNYGFITYGAIPFPVHIQWGDILLIIGVVLLIGFVIALFTVRSIPRELEIGKSS